MWILQLYLEKCLESPFSELQEDPELDRNQNQKLGLWLLRRKPFYQEGRSNAPETAEADDEGPRRTCSLGWTARSSSS